MVYLNSLREKSRARFVLASALLAATFLPITASADSTTGTTLTVSGRPTPGKQVIANVVVTGKHLVYGPPHSPVSVPGGAVQISINGTIVLSVQATGNYNSNIIDSGCVKPGPYPGTCDIAKYISNNTTFSAQITLPKGPAEYTISAKYTGDDDSHPSTSAPVVLKPAYPDITGALQILLD